MPQYTTIIWDMDGVLVDSERYWSDEDFFFLKQAVPDWSQVDESLFVGRGVDDMYRILTDRYGMDMAYDEYRHNYHLVAERVYFQKASLMPFARETLRRLRDDGVPQVLVSSSPREWIRMALDRFELEEYFSRIISADDAGGRGKPDPGIYRYAIAQIGVSLPSLVAVEDSPAGVEAARGAGLTVIGYSPQKASGTLPGADLMIHDLRRIPDLLKHGLPEDRGGSTS